jgi:hypothetical protein
LSAFRAAKEQLARQFLQSGPSTEAPTPTPRTNVVGVGVGEKTTSGRATGQRAVLLLVKRKYPPDEIAPANLLPSAVAGLPIDICEVGTLRALAATGDADGANPRMKHRPLRPGTSIGPEKIGTGLGCGTLGALVCAGSQSYLLTAAHVLGSYGSVESSAVCQPACLDTPTGEADVVAMVVPALELQKMNIVDAALARVGDGIDISPDILGVGSPLGAAEASVDDIVHKVGRTTGYTVGRVISVDADVKVVSGEADLVFQNQLLVVAEGPGDFCDLGDSGALVLHRQSRLGVGLLIAGGLRLGVATHLVDVLDALGVEMVTETAVPAEPEAEAYASIDGDQVNTGSATRRYTRLAP